MDACGDISEAGRAMRQTTSLSGARVGVGPRAVRGTAGGTRVGSSMPQKIKLVL